MAAAGVLVALAVLTVWTDTWASTEWLYYRALYAELEPTDARAVVVRSAILAIGALGALAFLVLLPRLGGWFSTMGSSSLVVYLFHGFVVKGLQYSPFVDWAENHPWLSLPLTTLGGVLLALLLASPPVARRLRRLVDPVGAIERGRARRAARASDDLRVP